jgi:hypothetical protein
MDKWPDKDPDATLDYGVDWSKFLATVGDTIANSIWIVPDGITKSLDTFNDTITTIWLEGGTPGMSYTLTNRITTAAGRVDDKSVKIKVKEL